MSSKKTPAPATTESFESALARLEDIVHELEEGDISLEECLARYQEGLRLHRVCQERLGRVEEELARLLEDDGSLSTWNPDDEGSQDSAGPDSGLFGQ
ncbi:MAG: exodeoxyribonuclease VII small subunit [Candidatus Cloacimonetes bacterium]|nr:exodeoxyribonuclease VII small subunit [Candidatus Cloacimonadota bacterium]